MNVKRVLGFSVLLGLVAGAVYLSTVGCCHLLGMGKKSISLTAGLGLSGSQRQEVAKLEQSFLARKQKSCEILCAKRAQMIQVLKQADPDRAVLNTLTEEIGQEQIALEKATLDHLIAVSKLLDNPQRGKLIDSVTDNLRTACDATACGMTPGCVVQRQGNKR